MSAIIGAGVTLVGLNDQDDYVTVNLPSSATEADEGKALTLDTTVNNGYKVAADGDVIRGKCEKVEVRTTEGIVVGTLLPSGYIKLPLKAEDTAAVGDSVVGGGNGTVRKANTASSGGDAAAAVAVATNYVVEKGTDYVVIKLIG